MAIVAVISTYSHRRRIIQVTLSTVGFKNYIVYVSIYGLNHWKGVVESPVSGLKPANTT